MFDLIYVVKLELFSCIMNFRFWYGVFTTNACTVNRIQHLLYVCSGQCDFFHFISHVHFYNTETCSHIQQTYPDFTYVISIFIRMKMNKKKQTNWLWVMTMVFAKLFYSLHIWRIENCQSILVHVIVKSMFCREYFCCCCTIWLNWFQGCIIKKKFFFFRWHIESV